MIGTTIKCNRDSEIHSGPLRRVDGEWVCQQCYDKEHGIERKQAKGRPITCPKCSAVLMTKFRGGKVNIGSMKMIGNKAILICPTEGCGYEKVVRNPFGGQRQGRDMALHRAREIERKAKEVKDAGQ